MNVPLLGEMTLEANYGSHVSTPIPVPMFGGKLCSFELEKYELDEHKDEFHTAVKNFLSGTPAVLREADEPLFRYYKRNEEFYVEDGSEPIASAGETWAHVQFGSGIHVTRRHFGDKRIYISVECECDWEPEHGLQLVFKNGEKITKLGGYDGHLTNSDATGRPGLEDVIYRL